jgi:hypothetical protein
VHHKVGTVRIAPVLILIVAFDYSALRFRAWEALKVVIKEEEEAQRQQTQAQASESTGDGVLDTAATANAATLGLGGWLDGEEEYRLREVE